MRLMQMAGHRFIAASVLCLVSVTAFAVDTAGGDGGWSSGSDQRQAHRISRDFIGFAGSKENAEALALGLRRGSEITLTSADGTQTSFAPATGHMGHGNVSKAMALAQRQLAGAGIRHPSPDQIETALNGGTVTAPDGRTTEMQGILQLRSQGMGWGKIAHTVGVKPGQGFKPLPTSHSGGHHTHGERQYGHGMVDGHGSAAGVDGGRRWTHRDGTREHVKVDDGVHQHRGGGQSGMVTAAGGAPMGGGSAAMRGSGRGGDGMQTRGGRGSGVVTAAGGAPVGAGEMGSGKRSGGEAVHRHGGRPAGTGIVTAAGTPGAQVAAGARARHQEIHRGGGDGAMHAGAGRHASMGGGIVSASGSSAAVAASASSVRTAGGNGRGLARGRVGKD